MEKAEAAGKTTVRLHTGDPCIYGAIREQMDVLDEKGIAYDYCPGVSAFCGAASALNLEYTERDHHPYGRENSGSAKGKHSVLCRASGNYGCFSQHRNAGSAEQKTDRRRLYGRYSCCDCV